MQSVLAVPVRCTIDIATQLGNAAAGLHDVKKTVHTKVDELNSKVTALTDAITSASAQSSNQANAVIWWSKALVLVTVVYTLVTAYGVIHRGSTPPSPAPVTTSVPKAP